MTSRELRFHRDALRAHAWAAEYHTATHRDDLTTLHLFQAAMLLGHGGGAWAGAAS